MTTYNTNLAAEFYVLSMLHRLGVDASLTLGNKKAVDILISRPGRPMLTVDVKGLAKRYDWPADNIRRHLPKSHFFALLSFEGKIDDPLAPPTVWILPATAIFPLIKRYRTRSVVSRKLVAEKAGKFRNNWAPLLPHPQ